MRAPGGKPALAGREDVLFSVSDSADLALVAIARAEIGVDVERIRDRPVAARAEARRLELFFEHWTAAEARGKARGGGLRAAEPGEDLACTSIDVGPDYAASVAVAADEVRVRLRPY